jgi:peptidoglycan pentaglycine glycine transferase (the first glycine)
MAMSGALASESVVQWDALEWEKDPPARAWDRALAELGGHPLQSCLWGDARRTADGIVQHRWLTRRGGESVWMIRVEERKIPGGKIAWAPRGPTGRATAMSLSAPPGFAERIKAQGFALFICDPWVRAEGSYPIESTGRGPRPQTIWLDLSIGTDAVFANFHPQIRKGIRRAARGGVRVETTRQRQRIDEFVALCGNISQEKGFALRVTSPLIETLLHDSGDGRDVEAVLFVSLKGEKLASGLLVVRAGRSVHQIWGATDRDMRQERVGEACQWGVIEWAIARGCTRYDLEGIDPVHNPSVYDFKKRLGGEEVTLHGHTHRPLNLFGRAMSGLMRLGALLKERSNVARSADEANSWP